MSLTIDQKISLAIKKFNSMGATIKSINECGRVALSDSSKLASFLGMFRTIDNTYEKFCSLWDELSELHLLKGDEFPTTNDTSIHQTITRYYYEAGSAHEQLTRLSSNVHSHSSGINNSSMNATQSHRCHLPKINLPFFDGKFSDWPYFRDTFQSLVHDDDTITEIDKFHFLIGSLSGSALTLIKNIPLQADNYNQAWEVLIKKFNNKRKLAQSFLKSLFNFKQLQGKPNSSSLQSFLTTVGESIKSFNNLKIPDPTEFILFELAVKCLDPVTREAFELANTGTEFPTFQSLIVFVQDRLQAFSVSVEDSPEESKPKVYPSPNKFYPSVRTTPGNRTALFTNAASANSVRESHSSKLKFNSSSNDLRISRLPSCLICSKRHTLTDCPDYSSSTPHQRIQMLKNWSGCRNCLHPGHITKTCSSKWTCRECGLRHHTTLHLPKSKAVSNETNKDRVETTQIQPLSSTTGLATSALSSVSSNSNSEVLLGTALAQVQDCNGSQQLIRLVIDCGSQHSFITEECVQRLGFVPSSFQKGISGVGHSPLRTILGSIHCILTPVSKIAPIIETEAVVVPSITHSLPQRILPISTLVKYNVYDLADPNFWRPGPIDFLLGADIYSYIITGLPISISDNIPQLMNTAFGYVVIGKHNDGESPNNGLSLLTLSDEQNIGQIMSRFWAIEEVVPIPTLSPMDMKCEEHFKQTHSRLPSGRYVVSLPFVDDNPEIPPSKYKALSRLYNLETKLIKNPSLKENYHAFLKEYEHLGHMVKTNIPAKNIIPHHAVLKANDISKLRVVFDGSAQSCGVSLNDKLLVGPKLQKDIGEILLNFRRYPIAFTTDIVKMYRQILVDKKDRAYQHILWRYDQDKPVEEYELTTVTYGLSCSPYLALRVINQLVIDEGGDYPLASKSLINDIYIDDIVTGGRNLEEAIELKDQLINLLAKGCFQLSKWASNDPHLFSPGTTEIKETPVCLTPHDDTSVKILGLQWNTSSDTFSYKVQMPQPKSVTKRNILSTIARLYDPLGYLSPTIFYAKVILQETWQHAIQWDSPVPQQIEGAWLAFLSELRQIEEIKIPRYMLSDQSHEKSILGFCDASQKGYCAAIYLRIGNSFAQMKLLKAKTKLAPIKPITVPRLELCGCLLLARLYRTILSFVLEANIKNTFLFTDSSVVLGWLHTPPHLLKTFVAHRITEIIDLTNVLWWRHISTSDNPADCGSRGLLPTQLVNHILWWNGPSWSHLSEDEWPIHQHQPSSSLPELKPNSITLVTTELDFDFITWMEKFSSYNKLIRSMAFVLRFISNSKLSANARLSSAITAVEFRSAKLKIISILQKCYYPDAFGNHSRPSNLLRTLNVFLDPGGLLRVGGRIQHSNLPSEQKHPLLLPRRSHLTTLLVDYYHKAQCHIGPNALQAYIQRSFWIPAARSLIKQRKNKCLICYKLSSNPKPVYMSNLPPERFAELRPFLNTGVDFAGPFLCRDSSRRKSPTTKSYLCIFICMATKALHLELVYNLSTEAFLDAMERFIARRGIPLRMISDCGTNFVGAARYLKDVQQWQNSKDTRNSIIQNSASRGIKWHFNPPSSPHFGGLWEAGVKSTKNLLLKAFGNQPFSERELTTIFAKIEAILNSRPLTQLSLDPSDRQPLTPGHFLVGEPLTSIPEPDWTDQPQSRLSRWQFMRQRTQFFWERWRNEYLHTLQQRKKWINTGRNIRIGELVLLKETNVPPLKWPLARVIEVHPGQDNIVRVVTIQTSRGIYKRPIMKLVSLSPITNTDEDDAE